MLHHLDALREIGVNAVNIDPYIEPKQILEKMPDVVVYGQIPPTKVLLYGTPEQVYECAKRDIEQAGPGKHLVLCTAGSINPGTSFENLKAMCRAAEDFGYIY
jgi:uroporphyrinogen decarboxylase